MKVNVTPTPLPPVDTFLKGQLGFMHRRATLEEKATIDWWNARITALAKEAPKASGPAASSASKHSRAA